MKNAKPHRVTPEGDSARSKRLYITMIALLCVAMFGTWLVRMVFSPAAGWRTAELETAVKTFSTNIMQARAEWMRKGQPANVFLSFAELSQAGDTELRPEGQVRILMSRSGWPVARAHGKEGCLELWHLLGHAETSERELQVVYHASEKTPFCTFYARHKAVFNFYPAAGQVKKLF